MDGFESDGIFWLPDNEDIKLAGRLAFDPVEGGQLSLFGGFGDIRDQFTQTPPILRIHGVAGKRYLTLDGCFNTGSNYEMPGINRQSYYVGTIITNHLFAKSESLTFDELSVGFDQLPSWIQRSGITVDEHYGKVLLQDQVAIKFTRPLDQVTKIDDSQLRLTSGWSLSGDRITDVHITQSTRLAINYPTAQELGDILGDIKALQDLVTLAIDAPAVPTEITLRRADITRGTASRTPQSMSYYAGQIAERVRLEKPQSSGRVLFQFHDIGGLRTVARWISVARVYRTVLGALLSIRYASGLYVENRFHNVISAAESLHRLRFSNEVRSAREFNAFRRELIRAVPKEHRNWLGNQLQYSNEPRLRERLTELMQYSETFSDICVDEDHWVSVIAESRNRLTHHEKERAIPFEQGDLYFLTESLFVLVMLCLFRECGVDRSVTGRITESQSIEFLRGKLSDIIPRLYSAIEAMKSRK